MAGLILLVSGAAGAYDARWTTALNNIKSARNDKDSTVYSQFVHKFNGNWVPSSVSGSNTANFITS